MNKKGWKITLEGLIGLVLGIAFVVLIFLVLFKLVGVFVPEEEQATPITVFNEINEYKDNEVHVIDFRIAPRTFMVGFNKNTDILDLSNLNLAFYNIRPVEILNQPGPKVDDSLRGGFTSIKQLNKPVICDGGSCICGCSLKEGENFGSVSNIYLLCKGKVDCAVLKNFDSIQYEVSSKGENPKKIFFLYNPSDDITKFFLTLRKEGKTIFIK